MPNFPSPINNSLTAELAYKNQKIKLLKTELEFITKQRDLIKNKWEEQAEEIIRLQNLLVSNGIISHEEN